MGLSALTQRSVFGVDGRAAPWSREGIQYANRAPLSLRAPSAERKPFFLKTYTALPPPSRLVLRNICAVPPSAAKGLEQRNRIGITIGLDLREVADGLLIRLFRA